jgi:hypothetical protein
MLFIALVGSLPLGLRATQVVAKDLDALAALVTPAYTAMNFATICATNDPQFHFVTSGPRGTAVHYAQHVKDEAIASLTSDEAASVLKGSADSARARARQELQKLRATDPTAEAAQIQRWCGSYAKDFILGFIREHDDNHDVVLQQVRDAKR